MGSIVARARARLLALVGLILLALWMEIIPPNGSPDERSHFVRVGGIKNHSKRLVSLDIATTQSLAQHHRLMADTRKHPRSGAD